MAHVALLSKGGEPVRGLQARPITVLPLVCRAWAKVRARQLRKWLEEHAELLVGSRQEAEFQAAVLATKLWKVRNDQTTNPLLRGKQDLRCPELPVYE